MKHRGYAMVVPLQDAVELALSGSVRDGPSALALILAQRKVSPADRLQV